MQKLYNISVIVVSATDNFDAGCGLVNNRSPRTICVFHAPRSHTGYTPTDVEDSGMCEERVPVAGLDGPWSGEVATSAIHQMRGLVVVVVVSLAWSHAPTSGCRWRSRDVGRRTLEKALQASTSRRERRSRTDAGGAGGTR